MALTMMQVRSLRAEVESAIEAYRAAVEADAGVRAAGLVVKVAQAKLHQALTGDAAACPRCASRPSCVVHERPHGVAFEVGCLPCEDHRAFGPTHGDALEAWNAGAAAYVEGEMPRAWLESWPRTGPASIARYLQKNPAAMAKALRGRGAP